MAGSQDPDDNPVAINVVPMVDVIFCLCVFFMCSMKWQEMEGKFRSWLPRDKGRSGRLESLEEIRVELAWDPTAKQTIRGFGNVRIRDDDHLRRLLRAACAERVRLGEADTACIVDGAGLVPWKEIVNVVNVAKQAKIERIEFTAARNHEAR